MRVNLTQKWLDNPSWRLKTAPTHAKSAAAD